MKKLLLFMLCITLLSGCGNKDGDSSKEEKPLSQHSQDLFSTLMTYAKDFYDSKKYEEYPKDENGLYTINLEDLEKAGYDISMFVGESGKACDKDNTNIQFDLEYKIAVEGSLPVITSISCD